MKLYNEEWEKFKKLFLDCLNEEDSNEEVKLKLIYNTLD